MVRFTLFEVWVRLKLVVVAWILTVVGGSIAGGLVTYFLGVPTRYVGWFLVFLLVAVPFWNLVMIVRAVVRLILWSRATLEEKVRIREDLADRLADVGALTARVSSVPGHTRHIPQDVKVAVAARDGGRCRVCGSTTNMQYDHVIPFSRGGSSLDPDNIQLLCGYHNRLKSDR